MAQHKILVMAAATMAAVSASAAIPSGYYDDCEGKSGQQLLNALHLTITDHVNVGYDNLYELYLKSDIRPDDNTIWDMYSTKHWEPTTKCGNYSGIGSCYNREHSFPKSWFGGKVNPMYADAYHLYPTDGQVNGYRSNYPYGECAGGTTWQSGSVKALGRLGKSTFEGYSGVVFEPDNEYKGDFARSYFYMAACYNDRVASWESPMLAGNNYPAFSDWALNLLLKWHRNDQVSPKETARNEAVSAAQQNRNPFIDHPELVEHIWGSKRTEPWHSAEGAVAAITSPADASTIDMGLCAAGSAASIEVAVKGRSLESGVALAIEGDQRFSVGPTAFAATEAMAGTRATVTFSSPAAAKATATLVVKSGTAESRVTLTAEAVAGIPVYDVESVTESSFTVRWVDIDTQRPDTRYTLNVTRGDVPIEGYPRSVEASLERFEVDGLEPSTHYTVQLASATAQSRIVDVTTADPLPSLQLLYDAELTFTAKVGQPSETAEILVVADNITDEIRLSVDEPFELSTDLATWLTDIILLPDEDRFFMRLRSDEAGRYTTAIEARSGTYVNDDIAVEGVVSDLRFVETFENASEMSSYDGGEYAGTAAVWRVEGGNIWDADNGFNGSRSMRFSSNGSLTLAEPKEGGIGVVGLDLRKWDNSKDPAATVEVEYTTDNGATWLSAGTATTEQPSFTRHVFTVNQTGRVGLRIVQRGGKRFNLDNVELTDLAGTTVANTLDHHSWQAYSRGGALVVEAVRADDVEVSVYNMAGAMVDKALVKGSTSRVTPLEKGVYIVVSGDFSRRVVVK